MSNRFYLRFLVKDWCLATFLSFWKVLEITDLIKRIFDIVLATVLALVALPVFLFIGVLIRLISGPPVFYSHERIGKGGEKFTCYKFRTMYKDADKRIKEYLEDHPRARKEWDKYKKLKSSDPRVTDLGRFIRKFSLDELPQIFNVIKGDMSLLGPRPYLPREKEEVGDILDVITEVKPGITSYWVVNGWNQVEFEERHKLEAWYVRNRSLWLDVKILIKTMVVVCKRVVG